MDTQPSFNFKDVLWAPAKALSAKRILVMTLFLVAGLGIYDIFTYIALAIEGEKVGLIYSVYGLLPFYKFVYANTGAQIVAAIGIVLAVLSVMLGMFGVAAFEMETVRGNRFFPLLAAIKFSLRRFNQIFLSELAIVLFIILVIVLFAIFGFICRIPFIGDWLFALFFVIPGFIIAIFTVFIFAVFQISLVLLPAVAAAERKGEAFNAILETFSTIIRQPVRWIFYTAYGLVVAKLCSFVYAYFAYRSVQFIVWASSFGGGEKLELLVRSGLSHLPLRADLVRQTFNVFPGVDWSVSLTPLARGGAGSVPGDLMAFMLFIVFASIIGYFLSIVSTVQARTYIALRYIKDEYKISDEDPLFFEEEQIAPFMDGEVGPSEKVE
ncbi:MAG TPA: hypothetical protein VJ983_01895 [candidate division Zixibacteria bacterium]|nr:hypothetical protein [candidate division Zixibacteria bacterium]